MHDQTIVFDLDGTLIDSAPDVCRALNRTLVPFGRRAHSIGETKGYLGQGARVLMEKSLEKTGDVPEAGIIDELTQAFLEDYAAHPVVDSTVFPGVFEALTELRSEGAKLAICTNKPSITTNPVMDIFKLDSYFDVIVCGDQVVRRKPDGAHIRDTVEAVNGDIKKAIMIGDSENDIYAAQDIGIPSIVVTFGYTHVPYDQLGATAQINHFSEVIHAIRDINTSLLKL